jgi:hypothetical protein
VLPLPQQLRPLLVLVATHTTSAVLLGHGLRAVENSCQHLFTQARYLPVPATHVLQPPPTTLTAAAMLLFHPPPATHVAALLARLGQAGPVQVGEQPDAGSCFVAFGRPCMLWRPKRHHCCHHMQCEATSIACITCSSSSSSPVAATAAAVCRHAYGVRQ